MNHVKFHPDQIISELKRQSLGVFKGQEQQQKSSF